MKLDLIFPRGMATWLLVGLIWGTGSGCATGSYFRTAKTLKAGQFEVGGGGSANSWAPSVTAYGAYGLSERLEFEFRFETYYSSLTPRYQLMSADWGQPLDFLVFLEAGVGSGWFVGPGAAVGRRYGIFEPFFTYRIRIPWLIHYLKAGTRIYVSSTVFLGIEGGIAAFSGSVMWGVSDIRQSMAFSGVIPEGGIFLGFNF